MVCRVRRAARVDRASPAARRRHVYIRRPAEAVESTRRRLTAVAEQVQTLNLTAALSESLNVTVTDASAPTQSATRNATV